MLAQWTIGPLSFTLWRLLPILSVSVLIPVVLHLLSSVRAPQVHFSTLRFLRLSMEKTARRRRLQHWLLLLLRTALLCLLLLGITQPLYKPKRGLAGGESQTAAAIVMDNSLSMAGSDGPRRRFDTARTLAKDLIRGSGKPRELALIFTNGREAQTPRELTYDMSTVLRRIDSAGVGLGSASMVSVLGAAIQAIKQSPLPNRVLYVLSDMQGVTFANLATCKALSENPDIPLMVLNCSRGDTTNLAVTDIQIKGHGRVVGATLVFEVTVSSSAAESRRAKVCIEVDAHRLDHLTQTVTLTPGGTPGSKQKVLFEHVFAQAGFHSGRVFIEGANDVLPADDSRDFALQIADRVRLMVITGPGGANDPAGPGYYVVQAMKVPSAVSPVVHLLGEVKVEEIAQNDVVICCDVPRFDEAMAAALRRFVADGRTLAIFTGPNVDVANYNATLGGPEQPLLPAILGEPAGDPVSRRDAAKLLRVDMEHPLFQDLYETQDKYQSVLVYCHLTAALHPQHPGSVVAWLDRDRPLLLEGRTGQGRCLLFTTSANTVWSNLPTKPVFLPVLLRICLGAIGGAAQGGGYAEGSQVAIHVSGDQPTDIDVVLPPDEAGRSATVRVQSKPDATGNTAVFAETFTRGIYTWQTVVGARQTGQFVVAADPAESDLQAITDKQLTETLPEHSVYVATGLDELRGQVSEAARGSPIWDYFLILVLIMATVEALFANRYRPAEVRMGDRVSQTAAA
jgi:hypothetical protein